MHNGSLAFIQLNRISSQKSNHSRHDSRDWLDLKPSCLKRGYRSSCACEPNPNGLKGRASQPHEAAVKKCLGSYEQPFCSFVLSVFAVFFEVETRAANLGGISVLSSSPALVPLLAETGHLPSSEMKEESSDRFE